MGGWVKSVAVEASKDIIPQIISFIGGWASSRAELKKNRPKKDSAVKQKSSKFRDEFVTGVKPEQVWKMVYTLDCNGFRIGDRIPDGFVSFTLTPMEDGTMLVHNPYLVDSDYVQKLE